MAKRRKKTRGPRKNPKRVAAGRKAARARWGKKTARKSRKSVKSLTKKQLLRLLSAGERMPKRTKKRRKSSRRSGYLGSAENLANLARGRKIRKARLASKGHYGPVFVKELAGGGTRAKRMAALAKARAVRAANVIARKAGIQWNAGYGQPPRAEKHGDPRFW